MLALWPSRRVLAQVGSWEITWYGVLYVVSFGLAWWLLPRLARRRQLELNTDVWLSVAAWGAVGAVVGGRLGYVLLYEPPYFLAHPLQVLALWDGGMASHGGFLGATAALWLVARRIKCDVLALADIVVVPAALGLALGRVGNFINEELYVSTAAHLLAIGKDLLIAGVCYGHLQFTTLSRTRGRTFALFLVLYSVLRWLTEYLRVQAYAPVLGLTYGQLLTLPLLAAGVWLMIWRRQAGRVSG